MEGCKLKSALTAMPEHRNIHGKLFGGHIMRKGFELAMANVQLVTKVPLQPIAMDDIEFKNPVEIGSIFLMNSQVAYTEDDTAVVRVYAQVARSKTFELVTTNTFYFMFKSLNGEKMPVVMPRTYGESLLYTDCKRRFSKI